MLGQLNIFYPQRLNIILNKEVRAICATAVFRYYVQYKHRERERHGDELEGKKRCVCVLPVFD